MTAARRLSAANSFELPRSYGRMLECLLLRPVTRGFSRDPGQDHSHHDNRHSQHSVLRPFFRLAERFLLRFATFLSLLVCLYVAAEPIAVPAQQADDDEDVVRVNTDLLLFPVRIRDKKGQAITGL